MCDGVRTRYLIDEVVNLFDCAAFHLDSIEIFKNIISLFL